MADESQPTPGKKQFADNYSNKYCGEIIFIQCVNCYYYDKCYIGNQSIPPTNCVKKPIAFEMHDRTFSKKFIFFPLSLLNLVYSLSSKLT